MNENQDLWTAGNMTRWFVGNGTNSHTITVPDTGGSGNATSGTYITSKTGGTSGSGYSIYKFASPLERIPEAPKPLTPQEQRELLQHTARIVKNRG